MAKKLRNQQKIFAFIDSQNLNLSIRDQGWQLDFAKFRKYLQWKYKVEKAFLFIGYLPGNQGLYTFLQEAGYIVIFKPTLTAPNGKIKGNVDAELVLHAMIQFSNYDKAIIVTGDGDFHCLIEHLKDKDKLEKVMVPNKHAFSSLLRKFMDDIVFMNELRGKLKYKDMKQ